MDMAEAEADGAGEGEEEMDIEQLLQDSEDEEDGDGERQGKAGAGAGAVSGPAEEALRAAAALANAAAVAAAATDSSLERMARGEHHVSAAAMQRVAAGGGEGGGGRIRSVDDLFDEDDDDEDGDDDADLELLARHGVTVDDLLQEDDSDDDEDYGIGSTGAGAGSSAYLASLGEGAGTGDSAADPGLSSAAVGASIAELLREAEAGDATAGDDAVRELLMLQEGEDDPAAEYLRRLRTEGVFGFGGSKGTGGGSRGERAGRGGASAYLDATSGGSASGSVSSASSSSAASSSRRGGGGASGSRVDLLHSTERRIARFVADGRRDIVSPLRVKTQREASRDSRDNAPSPALQDLASGKTMPAGAVGSDLSTPSLVKITELESIGAQLRRNREFQDHGPGTATCIRVHPKFVAIGTSRGLILLFDHFQEIRQVIGQNAGELASPVTSIAVSETSNLLVAGYASGHVCLWDIVKGSALKIVPDVHTHAITSVRFFSTDAKVLSVDSRGVVFKLVFSKVIFNTCMVDSECLIDRGAAGEIVDVSILQMGTQVLAALGAKNRTVVTTLLPRVKLIFKWGLAPEDKSSEHASRIAWVASTLNNSLPAQQPVLARSSGIKIELLVLADAGSDTATPATSSASAAVAAAAAVVGAATGASSDSGEGRTDGSSGAAGNAGQASSGDGRSDTTGAAGGSSSATPAGAGAGTGAGGARSKSQHHRVMRTARVAAPVLSLAWLNADELLAVQEHSLTILNGSLVPLETVQLTAAFHPTYHLPDRVPEYTYLGNATTVHDGCMYILSPGGVHTVQVQSLHERVEKLVTNGQWLDALAFMLVHTRNTESELVDMVGSGTEESKAQEGVAGAAGGSDPTDTGFGTGAGAAAGAQVATRRRVKAVTVDPTVDRASQLLLRYVGLAMENAPSTSNVGMGATSHFRLVAGVCVEYCIETGREALLFGDIYRRFREMSRKNVILSTLEPYIMTGQLVSVPPSIMADLMEHFESIDQFAVVERCLLHVSLHAAEVDFNSIIARLKQHRSYPTLAYVFARGLGDVISPATYLFEEIAGRIQNVREFRWADGAQYAAHCLLLMLKRALKGACFPMDQEAAVPVENRSADSILNVFVEHCVPLPPRPQHESGTGAGSSDGTTASSEEATIYLPRLIYLLLVDAPALYTVLDDLKEAVSTVSRNSEPGTTQQADEEKMAAAGAAQRQRQRYEQGDGGEHEEKKGDADATLTSVRPHAGGTSPYFPSSASLSKLIDAFHHVLVHAVPEGLVHENRLQERVFAFAAKMVEAHRVQLRREFAEAGIDFYVSRGTSDTGAAHKGGHHAPAAHAPRLKGFVFEMEMEERRNVFAFIRDMLREVGGVGPHSHAHRGPGHSHSHSHTHGHGHGYGPGGAQQDAGRRMEEFSEFIIERLGDLSSIDKGATMDLISEYLLTDYKRVLRRVQAFPDLQLEVLDMVFSNPASSQGRSSQTISGGAFGGPRGGGAGGGLMDLREEGAEEEVLLYVRLLAARYPSRVYGFLTTHDNYPLDECLELCRSLGVRDAEAYLMERTGAIEEGLALVHTELREVAESITSEQLTSRSAPEFLRCTDTGRRFHELVLVALDICERSSSRGGGGGGDQGRHLWFNLLDFVMDIKRVLTTRIGESKNLLVQQALAPAMQDLMRRMSHVIPSKDIVLEIAQAHTSSRLAEFQQIIVSMLDSYEYELSIYNTAALAAGVDLHQLLEQRQKLKTSAVRITVHSERNQQLRLALGGASGGAATASGGVRRHSVSVTLRQGDESTANEDEGEDEGDADAAGAGDRSGESGGAGAGAEDGLSEPVAQPQEMHMQLTMRQDARARNGATIPMPKLGRTRRGKDESVRHARSGGPPRLRQRARATSFRLDMSPQNEGLGETRPAPRNPGSLPAQAHHTAELPPGLAF